MDKFINIQINEKLVKEMLNDKLECHLKQLESRFTFWDMKELCRQTCMSENSIKEKFFYDERFPKRRVGGKWYFPVVATTDFLLTWLSEQPNK
ncbi:hypothetical protein [Sutcliffiella sp. FSL R7-0096]|uniref:hypothetical protein n=1 Tax=Sutcliffiella sp. FSL R7-0096 TaxID=2921670 RepID=UPI00315A7F04